MKTPRIGFKKARAVFANIQAKWTSLAPQEKPTIIILMVFLCMILIVLLFKGCVALAFRKVDISEPMVIREKNTLRIPLHSPLRNQLKIKTVKMSSVPHIVSIPGIVEADPTRVVNVFPPLVGRIRHLNVKLGDMVQRGQVLAVIISQGLSQAYSDNQKALGVFTQKNDALNRARKVNRAGANATKDIEIALSDYLQAEAELKRTKATLKALDQDTLSQLVLKAPLAGKITAINYGRRSFITDPTVPFFTLINTKSVWVTANLPENISGIVKPGLPVDIELFAYPKQTFHGKIAFLNAFLEPDTRRNKARIALSNTNSQLQPNMFATVKIALPEQKQIIIPLSAVLMNDDTLSVYVETEPWVFTRRTVLLGSEDNNKVRVLSGLKASEKIIVQGGVLVND